MCSQRMELSCALSLPNRWLSRPHLPNSCTYYWKYRCHLHVAIDKCDTSAVCAALDEAARANENGGASLVLTGAGMGVDMGLSEFRSSLAFREALGHPDIARYEDASDDAWFAQDPALAWGLNYSQLDAYRSAVVYDGYEWPN